VSLPKKLLILPCIALVCVVSVHFFLERDLHNIAFGPLGKIVEARVVRVVTIPTVAGKEPEIDEKFFSTYIAASNLGLYVKDNLEVTAPLQSSTDVKNIDSGIRLDAWGRPFCVFENADRVAVFSGGRSGFDSSRCDSVEPLTKGIQNLKMNVLNEYPTGVLAVVISRTN
jgi:hypothetical protein